MAVPHYAILRFAKYKGPEISGIEAHNERTKEKYASNPDIDPSRTHLNFHLIKPERKYRAESEKQIAEAGCRTRSDSVRVVEALITATPEFFKGKKRSELKEFFNEALEFIKQNQAPETIISAVVHLDEKNPHMHLCFVPITAKGRLSSKDVIGGPQGLVKWQDRFYEHMRQRYPDLSRGLPKKLTHRKHVPPYMFKLTAELYKHYDEICQAINSIGVLNSGRKKEEAIALLGRYAPEMTQLKAQVASTDKQIADLERELAYVTEGRATAWRANQDYKQELEEANYKLYQLNREQKKLEGIISLIPPELLAQLTKTERDARKNQERGKNR